LFLLELDKYIFLKKWSFFLTFKKNSHELDFYVRIIEYLPVESPKRQFNPDNLKSLVKEDTIERSLFRIKKTMLQVLN
jgi:hypothetical protein